MSNQTGGSSKWWESDEALFRSSPIINTPSITPPFKPLLLLRVWKTSYALAIAMPMDVWCSFHGDLLWRWMRWSFITVIFTGYKSHELLSSCSRHFIKQKSTWELCWTERTFFRPQAIFRQITWKHYRPAKNPYKEICWKRYKSFYKTSCCLNSHLKWVKHWFLVVMQNLYCECVIGAC